uniref:Uncharacterized protein n=1 Tax=Sphaerodactylus townsendi TaxID=933632 RepID=A0ACB8GE32_9SAUR
MEGLPGSASKKLQIFGKVGSERWAKNHAPVDKYYKSLVRGDLKKLKALIDQYYEDVNMTFEISENELEWQVKSHATFGLSDGLEKEFRTTQSFFYIAFNLPTGQKPLGSSNGMLLLPPNSLRLYICLLVLRRAH